MGGDGGVIAANRRFLRQCGDGFLNDAQKESLDKKIKKNIRTKVCAISNEKLEKPIAACELGYLYNKSAVVSALLEKSLDPAFSHLRGLKDLIEAKLTPVKNAKEDSDEATSFMCPVTFTEFNGRYPFIIIRSTGWVLSEKAIAEVGMDSLQAEYGPFSADDLIKLAPDDEEMEEMRKVMLERRERLKTEKGKRKRHCSSELKAETKEKKDKLRKKGSPPDSSEKNVSITVKQAADVIRRQKKASAVYDSLFGTNKPTPEQLFASGKASCPI